VPMPGPGIVQSVRLMPTMSNRTRAETSAIARGFCSVSRRGDNSYEICLRGLPGHECDPSQFRYSIMDALSEMR
jgi:hypothetical protein